jgi:hypothetical protein
MSPNNDRRFAGCLAVALLAAAPLAAADDKDKKEPSAAEKEMMEKYVKAAEPGPVHKELQKLVGKWKLDITSWHGPGAPPTKSEGTAEFKPLLGGRYLQQDVKSDMAGQPFEGIGFEGYDNVTKERFGTWADSMSTGLMIMRGKCAAGAKKCTFKGESSDPIAGKKVKMTETMTMVDDNKFTFELQGPGPDGKVFKMIEIVYTRQ